MNLASSRSLTTSAAIVLILISTTKLSAQAPTVTRIETRNFAPGQVATLTAHGKGLKDVLYLWTPVGQVPVKPTEGKPNEAVAHFEGKIPETAGPGIYEVRIVRTGAVSARQYVVIDDLPSFALPDACEVYPPKTTLPNSCCVNGYLNALKPRFVGLALTKGQTINVEVVARRLNSPLDPVLRILDSTGNELAYADDTSGLAGDAQIAFTAPADGRYTVELRDVRYSGGGGHIFHLRVGSFPLVQGTLPRRTSGGQLTYVADGQADTAADVTLADANVVETAPLNSKHGSGLTTVAVADFVPVLEQEPNDTREKPSVVDSSARGVAGRFDKNNDIDWYRISVPEKQHVCITAFTRNVGSPADVVLKLHDKSGKKLQESDDVGANDAQLSWAAAAGDYFLSVTELSGHSGPAWTYDLAIDRGGRIEITTAADTVGVPSKGTVTIPVSVKRLGNSSSVELSVSDLPKGIKSSPVIVGAKQKTAHIALQWTDGTAKTFQHPFTIRAKTLPDGDWLPALYVPPPPKTKTTPNYALQRLQTGIFAHNAKGAAFSLSADKSKITVTKGGEVKVAIKAVRQKDWQQPIAVASAIAAAELPVGVTVGTAKLEKDSVELSIKADDKAIPGRYSISLKGTLKKDKTTIIQPVPTITVDVQEAPAAK